MEQAAIREAIKAGLDAHHREDSERKAESEMEAFVMFSRVFTAFMAALGLVAIVSCITG